MAQVCSDSSTFGLVEYSEQPMLFCSSLGSLPHQDGNGPVADVGMELGYSRRMCSEKPRSYDYSLLDLLLDLTAP